jgi:hypothetical protein
MIYLLTAIGLSTGGSKNLHTNNTENNTNNNRSTQISNVDKRGPCPVLAGFALAFALQLKKQHGKISVRLIKTSVSVHYIYYQNTHTLQNPHKHTHYKTHTYTHTHYKTYTHIHTHTHTHYKTHTHTHTLQNTHTHTHITKQYKITTVLAET